MTRLHFKGGAWTNSEDQVLRASLTVYGLQNWERVASTLVKKTAAQCRERWENYLDPRLNISEAWTTEEEENLVELQSLFPNQWSLISQEVSRRCGLSRPAWLCEEHYHSLLDALEYKRQRETGEGKSNASLTLEEFLEERKRQRGVHRGIETRAARPDAINMEASEKEMVEFAMSRLANQDGKKGLRKERRKQLEHTSFLAKLQSNREAIESGTLSARAKKRMERAMMEDSRSGPRDAHLIDHIAEDSDTAAESGGDATAEGNVKFQPIDLGTDKKAAGIQPKQRVLIKRLPSDGEGGTGRGLSKGTPHAGVNLDLLRVASAGAPPSMSILGSTSSKGVVLLEDDHKSANVGDCIGGPKTEGSLPHAAYNTVSFDDLFASLPVATSRTHGAVAEGKTSVGGLVDTVTQQFLSSVETQKGVEAPAVFSDGELEESLESPSRGSVEGTSVPIDFTTPYGRSLLHEAKRRVAAVGRRMLVGTKRERDDDSNRRQACSTGDTGVSADGHTRRLVHALVTNQLGESTQLPPADNVVGAVRVDCAVANDGPSSLRLQQGWSTLYKQVVCDGNVKQKCSSDLWRDVEAGDAIKELEDQIRERKEQLEALAVRSQAAPSVGAGPARPERIISICFSPSSCRASLDRSPPDMVANYDLNGSDKCVRDLVQSTCVFWGRRLQEAQRKFIFYSVVREAEQREMKRRLEQVGGQLEAITRKERALQEEFRRRQIS